MYLKKFTYKPSLQTWHLPFVQYVVGRNIFEGRGFDSRGVQSICFFFFLVLIVLNQDPLSRGACGRHLRAISLPCRDSYADWGAAKHRSSILASKPRPSPVFDFWHSKEFFY